jgi:hypothetical protein
MTEKSRIAPYAPAMIKLLQGIVYSDEKEYWDCLINYRSDVWEYFQTIGIDLFIYEADGFAFLRQKERDGADGIKLPELMVKRQLSYPVTLLCVLLLERLIEFDMTGGESSRLIMDRDEIKEMVRIFLPDAPNEARLIDRIDEHINRLLDYGFLRALNSDKNKFEVRRILKAKIPADTLLEIKSKLRGEDAEPA